MKNGKIEFVGSLNSRYSNNHKKNEVLLLKLINDEKANFKNFTAQQSKTYLISAVHDGNWTKDKSSFIYLEKENNILKRKYIRINEDNEMFVGYSFYHKSYIELFISEEYYDKHEDFLEQCYSKWMDGKESYVESKFVQRNKLILDNLIWEGGEPTFPDNLYIDFNVSNQVNKYEIVKRFVALDSEISDINRVAKLMTKKKNQEQVY